MNTYKSYLKDKNSYFHQTEKKVLNLLKTNDLKHKDKFLSSKVKNRLIDSLLYLHQFKPNCEIRKNFRKKYNLEMHGGKKEMITLRDIIAPTTPKYNQSDLEKQFQEITTKIFKNQKEYVYPDGDQNIFLEQPQFDLGYKINKQDQQKKEIEHKNNQILELLKKSGKNTRDRRFIFNEININKRTKLELSNFLLNQRLNQNEINFILDLKKNILEKIEIKNDLNQINQLTDIISESKSRTTRNYIETSTQDINNNLMRTEMDNPNNLIFDSIAEYNLEFVNMNTQTNQKCKYQLKDENSKKNNEIRKKYKEYQKYEDLIPLLKKFKIRNPNHDYEYIYDVDEILSNYMGTNINQNQHSLLFNKLNEYNTYKNENVNVLPDDTIIKLNNALLGLQLLFEIDNIDKNIAAPQTELNFFNQKLYSPGIKYPNIKELIQHLTTLGNNANINPNTISDLLNFGQFKDDIFIKLDMTNGYINNILQQNGINFLVNDDLYNYFTSNAVNITNTIQKIINIYSSLINNNNSKVNLENIKSGISDLIHEIVNKEDLLKNINQDENSCKYNTQCGEDNLCHLKKCIYEVLASSGKLKGENLTGLEIRNTLEQKFKKMYPNYEKENFINECNWLDGKVISFLENEYNIRIILINKFDYNFNQELIEYNEFQDNTLSKNSKEQKGTLEDLNEIKNINNSIKNIGVNYINKNSMASAVQNKFSTKNTQGSILCQNLKVKSDKIYNKVVFIIYNTDDNYQLLKINNKTQLSITEIPYELKMFVNNSCNTDKPILKISDNELIKNKVDYKLLENKILDFLNKNKLSTNSNKINYFRNLINLYLDQDDLNRINTKLSNMNFKIENNYFVSNIDSEINLGSFKFLTLKVKRNNNPIDILVRIPNLVNDLKKNNHILNLGEINNDYILNYEIDTFKKDDNKLKINFKYRINPIKYKALFEDNFDLKIINHNISHEYLFKLFDFICYLNNDIDDYYLGDLDNLVSKNIYLKSITDNLDDKDEFLKAFKIYKYLELEKVNNSKIFSPNYNPTLVFMVKASELFNNLINKILVDISINIDKQNYIKTTKLFKIFSNSEEKQKVIDMIEELNLEYQYLFSIFIRDFFNFQK
jgi:hypothetical protein